MSGHDLAQRDRDDLKDLEQVVHEGMATFMAVGNALSEIRDRRLYRDEHATFEQYLQARWELSRSRGYQLMQAAKVASLMSTTVDTAPANEAIARELAPLLDDPEALSTTWRAVLNMTDKPTAEDVRDLVQVMLSIKRLTDWQSRGLNLLHQIEEFVTRDANRLTVNDLILILGVARNVELAIRTQAEALA